MTRRGPLRLGWWLTENGLTSIMLLSYIASITYVLASTALH